ncbi:MAG: hypothetical protein ACPMAQ_14885, partial [Phycisphaerae bacterium]
MMNRYARWIVVGLVGFVGVSTARAAAPELLGVYYRPDESFPAFAPFWNEGAPIENMPANPNARDAARAAKLGCSIHIFVRNTGAGSLAIDDLALAGISLEKAIAFSDQR